MKSSYVPWVSEQPHPNAQCFIVSTERVYCEKQEMCCWANTDLPCGNASPGLQDKKETIRGVYSVIDQLSRTHLNTLERLIFHLVR